ncbi:MAG: copper homeostasis protein CutC [Nakamurella sp.]
MAVLTEVCVDSAAGVRIAAAAGADRVELCMALEVGGVTPSIGLLEPAVESAADTGIAVHVLIRPRPGDFVYRRDEIDVMGTDVVAALRAGADGVVIGALTVDGAVDIGTTTRLVAAAAGCNVASSVTFHRAFDVSADPFAALDALRRSGIHRVLTSGQASSALAGAELLAALVRSATDDPEPLSILAGGGIRPDTVGELLQRTGVSEVHFSGRRSVDSPMLHRNRSVAMGNSAGDADRRGITDPELVQATVAAVRAAGR